MLQFLLILAEQNAICTIWAHDSHHRHIFSDSMRALLALSEQRALCTFFSLLLSASLLCCGPMVSSARPSASSSGRLPEAFFLVFRLESKGAKASQGAKAFFLVFRLESQGVKFQKVQKWIQKVQRCVDLVDLVKSFATNIILQNLACHLFYLHIDLLNEYMAR